MTINACAEQSKALAAEKQSQTGMTAEDVATLRESSAERGPSTVATATLIIGAIAVGAATGLLAPTVAVVLSDGMDATILVMIGLLFFEQRARNLLDAFANLRFLAIAWSANFLIVPVIGFALASLVALWQPLVFVGLMLYFLAPCTDWFLGFTRMARGDTGLGAALIPVNLLTQLMLFPFWIWLFTEHSGLIDFAAMPSILAQWFLLPFIAAQTLRISLQKVVSASVFRRLLAFAGCLVPLALATLVMQIFASNVGLIATQLEIFALITIAVLLYFTMTFCVGAGIARIGLLPYPQRALLNTTMAARNAPLMLAMTAIAIPDQPLVLAVIAFGMLIEIPHLTLLKQILLQKYSSDPHTDPIGANRE